MEPIREDDLPFARKVLERRSGQLLDELSALKRRIQEESIHDTRVASRRMRAYAALFLAVLALSAALSGFSTGVALVLTTLLAYGFSPSIAAFRRVLSSRAASSSKSPAE